MSYRFLSCFLLGFALLTVSLAETPTPRLVQVPVTPPKHGVAVPVRAGVFVEEISAIDEGKRSFELHGALDLEWHDDRLAFDPIKEGASVRTYLEQDVPLLLEKIWWPTVQFVNQLAKPETENQELMVTATGDVLLREKLRVTLDSSFEMRKFPFDTQQLKVRLASFAYRARELQLTVDNSAIGLAPGYRMSGWIIDKLDERVYERKDLRDRAPFSEIESTITIRREPGFFVTKFLIPLIIVMLLISAVLWIPPHQVKDRISATLTGMLTSAAYGFTITNYLPTHVYNTFLDSVVILALVHSSLLMVENVLSFRQADDGHLDRAKRLDRISRFLFPCVFLGGVLMLALVYGVL